MNASYTKPTTHYNCALYWRSYNNYTLILESRKHDEIVYNELANE